jgi:hypothetical protein
MKHRISRKALNLVKKFGYKIEWTEDVPIATAVIGRGLIRLNPKNALNYDVLHELSHLVCGYQCCLEHCEFEAHGGAKVLCKLLGLSKGWSEKRMNCYAGCSARKACGRINL